MTIHSLAELNNDGFDIDSSNHVTVQNCTVDSEDDSICLKATSVLPCADITVTGCTLTSGCGTIKLGTESLGDFHNIKISNCHVVRAGKGGIKLLCEDGALMQDVTISDITMDKADTPIMLRLGSRLKKFRPTDATRDVGRVDNVTIQNVVVHDGGTSMLCGIPGHPVTNVTLANIEVHGPKFVSTWKINSPIPEKEYRLSRDRHFWPPARVGTLGPPRPGDHAAEFPD